MKTRIPTPSATLEFAVNTVGSRSQPSTLAIAFHGARPDRASNAAPAPSAYRRRNPPAALKLAVLLSAAGALLPAATADAGLYQFTTLAGQAGAAGCEDGSTNACGFYNPNALALDAQGDLYVADSLNHLIRVIRPTGAVRTLAGRTLPNDGTGHHEAEPEDGLGRAAHFYYPAGLTFNRGGNLVVADSWHHTLREVTPAGQTTTLAGHALAYGYADGIADQARFQNPVGLATDTSGAIFISDRDSHLIRKITTAGVVSTVAGQPGREGAADGPAASALFNHPAGLALDRQGNLFIADTDNCIIRKLTPAGRVSTVAGLAGSAGHADGRGSAARFFSPTGVAVDGAGNVFVTDTAMHVIRMITPHGDVSTVGGSPGQGGSADGVGAEARFYCPLSLVVTATGDLLIADAGNHVVRRGTPVTDIRLELRLLEGRPRLRVIGPAGSCGIVECRTSLDAGEWQEFARFELNDSPLPITAARGTSATQCFFRVRP